MGGISRYFYELITHFTTGEYMEMMSVRYPRVRSENYFYNQLPLANNTSKKVPTKYPFSDYLISLPGIIQTKKILSKSKNNTVFHPTALYLPYKYDNRHHSMVVTCHDLIYNHYQKENGHNLKHKLNMMNFHNGYKNATRIIAISNNTKKELMGYYDFVSPDMVDVIYHGFSLKNRGILNNKFDEKKLSQLMSGKRYLLFVGNRLNHKNFPFFVSAIAPLLLDLCDLYLICVGGGNFKYDEEDLLNSLGIKNKIIHLFPTDEELTYLYQHALTYICPSLYEGFGLPILEAYANSCPAILNNTSCLPEIGGEGALYFESENPISLQNCVYSLYGNDNLRETLISKGHTQVKKFSWDKCAKKTYQTYQRALE